MPAPTVVVEVTTPWTTVVVALPEDAAVEDEMLVVVVRAVLELEAAPNPVVVVAAFSGAENEAPEPRSPQPANAEVAIAKTTSEPNATLDPFKEKAEVLKTAFS